MMDHNFLDAYKEEAAMHWWFGLPVSRLSLKAPTTVGPTLCCQDAVEIMGRERFDQLPVTDGAGYETFKRLQ